jgi:hypothetical protein
MVNNRSITFDDTIHSEVASVASIRDLPVFESLDRSLHGIQRRSAILQDQHSQLCSTAQSQHT